MKKELFIAGLVLFILIDLWMVNIRYVNNEKRDRDYVRWVKKYDKSKEDLFEQIAFKNPLRFLFPDRVIPKRIKDFYGENNLKKLSNILLTI